MLLLVGDGVLGDDVRALAAQHPTRFRVLEFQNQSRMPLVYRLGNLFVLPSAYGETWGLAANEAMACGRPVLVSDHVGCAQDLVDDSCGAVFPADDWSAFRRAVERFAANPEVLIRMGELAMKKARLFDIPKTEASLYRAAWETVGHAGG
jgi:glycosyltransferase involved in cell wall biosynthesis